MNLEFKYLDKYSYRVSLIVSILYLMTSLTLSYQAVLFASRTNGNYTTDILLDNLPVINTDIIFTEGAVIFIILTILLLVIHKRKYLPFVIKSLALLILVRSFFVILTHMAPFPDRIKTDLEMLRYITLGRDLFFSGHTALPFMMALVFWNDKLLRVFFIFASVTAGAAVIFGHLHYSIDVFSAFFITYGTFQLSKKFFNRDFEFINK